jgi:hypothetical protein
MVAVSFPVDNVCCAILKMQSRKWPETVVESWTDNYLVEQEDEYRMRQVYLIREGTRSRFSPPRLTVKPLKSVEKVRTPENKKSGSHEHESAI